MLFKSDKGEAFWPLIWATEELLMVLDNVSNVARTVCKATVGLHIVADIFGCVLELSGVYM